MTLHCHGMLEYPQRMSTFRSPIKTVCVLALGLGAIAVSGTARADDMTIKEPGHHPMYRWEIEPHAIIQPFEGPGTAQAGGGVGARATIVLVDNGFVRSINNSVGLGFGGDLLFAPKAGLWVPVVMQWNFWLSRKWSVFGEPGVGVYFGHTGFGLPIFEAGGRVLLSDDLALTLRVGYPQLTFGVSFLL
ncbi:MAG TPA: hypothetical protein VL137_07580 [Polyangiaceae bacterium]|nr:hypothetical protein [Polyangiaceae bacterium]